MSIVQLENVSKRYPGSSELAVQSFNLTVADGEFIVLLGPSGCGKSTVLRMIAGLESITSGTLRIDDQVKNTVPARDRDIAMVFQSYALYPHMTVEGNLGFGLRRRGVAKEETANRVSKVAQLLGLTRFLSRKPHVLSGGQRQRVALGRAIVRDPKVFLFDEPLSNLDAALRVSTRNELVKLHQRLGATIIYVTHDQVEAMTMGQRICIINSGKLVQVGEPLKIYREPANTFVAKFLGNPPMNLLSARLETAGQNVAVRFGHHLLPLPVLDPSKLVHHMDRTVIFGIRPEDLHESSPEHPQKQTTDFSARVEAVEALGAEILLILALEGADDLIRARLHRDSIARVGDTIRIHINIDTVHLFDPESTRLIECRRD